jgi:hypothetical protein
MNKFPRNSYRRANALIRYGLIVMTFSLATIYRSLLATEYSRFYGAMTVVALTTFFLAMVPIGIGMSMHIKLDNEAHARYSTLRERE